ncbi:leucine-rich repeat-containing protein 27-like isoform X2 [Mugil cephalus]|uniref:leucine-rich repeat-containing protein 27-like isoform X2 n=1 Tax=Mugil cephalus TaxID=48193 RepID=UPI001FB64234|nr:leucine-rich repeat-containing protein 27-like isoform X2 [Mugil cephalus]
MVTTSNPALRHRERETRHNNGLCTLAKHLCTTSVMASPEEEESEAIGDRLGFVFGSSAGKTQSLHSPAEKAEPRELAEYHSTETLCLSRSKLNHFPSSILKNRALRYLSLEGNQISSIPDSMFVSLPYLLWLDLRKNQLVSLPAEIGSHRVLKTLLLEGNPISELPPELGYVITLKGLNLRDCPITFPPQDIVHQGLQSILQYLRSVMTKRSVSARSTPPELPVVEKLQLSELMESSVEEQDESVDELQRFRELKNRLMLLDKAEMGTVALCDVNTKPQILPVTKRKKKTTKTGPIPELPLFDSQQWKRPEERKQAAMKELKEKQVIFEQRRKSQEALRKWRTQTKVTQEKKMPEHNQKRHERQRRKEEEADSNPSLEESDDTHGQIFDISTSQCEEDRSARVLQRQIRARAEKIQERHRNPRGSTTEQMAAAERDVEEMRKLQARLLERKRNRGRDMENSFTIYTGDTWPSFINK